MELIGEDINDNAQMQVLALSTLAREAEHALTGPVPTERPVYFDTEFDAAKGLPPGLSRLADPDAPAATVTGDAPSLTLPPGLTRQAARDDTQRLASLLPTFNLLYQNLGANLMWAYVALDNGLMRVLVVDDDPASRHILAAQLAGVADCVPCGSGVEAVEAVEAAIAAGTPFDVVFLDIIMPHMRLRTR